MTTALRAGEFRPRLEAVSEMSGAAGGRGGDTISMAAVPEGATPLMYACQQSRVNELANMISAKPANIRDRDRTLKTALHYCAENQKPDCAELLVTAAPDLVDARDEDGYTPLHLAVISGNIGFVRFLLGRGASLAALDNERHSVVHWATVCGELEALQEVLEAGAEASSPDMHGGYPVHYAAQMCGPASDANGDKSVGMAVLTALLDHKVPVNVTDKDGRQPILWAASAGSADAILALVNAGANVEADDKDGLTALHCAASRGHTECLETLITLCGAQVDLMDSNGCTALFYAATLGHADATQLLLTLNAQPNRQDRKGRTPAHCGAAKGQLETLRLLSEHEADMWVRNAKGDYALHEAVASGRKELVTWLLTQRPDAVNAANNDSRCPLHIAAIYNNVQMCKILLDAESLVNPVTRSSKGQLMTPLDAALYKGNRGCAKYLQLHGGVPATKLTPEAAALRGVAKSEIEQRESRSRGATPDMLNVPKGKKEPRSLQTSPVTITGNKQLTLVDSSHNSHILQVHVQDQVSVMGDESHEISESGGDRRTKKRRHKRHSRRTDDDDYASNDSDSRDRRRRRRRDEESSEEDEEEEDGEEEEEEGSGSKGGRKRRGGRREREKTDGSDYESDESEHSRRGRRRRDKNRRGKKERRSLRRERSDDLNDGERRSTKGRERKRVIKEETKRSEIIKSKKVIEESMDDDEAAPITKSSITTSEERKEQTLRTVSEVVDGEEVPTETEKTGEERVIQVVEAEVHQEQQNEEDTQDGQASKTDVQTDDQGESTTVEGESTKKANRKSKLKKMDKEEIASKQSESQKSEGAAAASATEDDKEAAERAAQLEEQRKSEEEEEEERKRQEEEEAQRRLEEEEEKKRQEEEEEQRRSEEEEEKKAREEAERQAKEEAERMAREEEERKAREEAERIAREEAERKAKEEAEQKAREEAERKAKEEAERLAREEAERKEKEEAERIAKEEAERKALEEQKHGRMAVEVKKYEDVKNVIENMKGDAETEDKSAVENEPATEEEVNKTSIQTTESAPPLESEDTEADRSEVSMLKTPRSPSVQSSPRTPEKTTPRRRSNRLAAEFKKYEDVKTVVGNMKSHIQVANDKHDRMAVEVKKYEDVKTVIENMKGEEEYDEEEKRSPRRAKDGGRKKVRSKSRDRKKDEEEGEQKRKASGKKKGVRVNEGGKTKREVNVSMDKIVDESNARGGDEEQQEDEEEDEEEFYSEKSMSGDEESVDLDPGRALVKIIGRAREEREPRSRRRRRKMSGDRPARARSSFSVVSDSLSTHLDSGFEPSPRNDRINEARDRRRDRSAGPELTPASVTQAVQHSIRRYHLERRIFHELLELKRLQIRAGRSNEAVLVKRLAEEYRKAALDVGLIPYQGPFSFRTFENYLYDQLRKLQIAERKMVPKLQSNDELERLTAALRKTRAGKAFLESVPDSPAYCTHSTHRCSHATHAYTGIPCAAYITKANHHTVPKPPRSGFLPKIEAPEKRSKEGQSAEIARCLRYVDPSRPVTLELSHGKDRQVISLPTENLDKNKRYYVTFTIKGGESASETTGDERKHRHAKSF